MVSTFLPLIFILVGLIVAIFSKSLGKKAYRWQQQPQMEKRFQKVYFIIGIGWVILGLAIISIF